MRHDKENELLIFEPIDQFFLGPIDTVPECFAVLLYRQAAEQYERRLAVVKKLSEMAPNQIGLKGAVDRTTLLGILRDELQLVVRYVEPNYRFDEDL